MGKATMKKLTLKDLISKEVEIKNKKKQTRELSIASLDGTIVIEKPSIDLIIDAAEKDAIASDRYLVYNCIVEPNLKDKELQTAFGCVEPDDILKIFEAGEISSIAKELMKFAGYTDSVKVINEIKN